MKNTLGYDSTQIPIGELSSKPIAHKAPQHPQLFSDTLRGINFTKSQHWFKNYHTLTKRELNRDFYQLKALGINTIKRYGPTAYVRNVLSVAEVHEINVHYGFWIPESLNFVTDEEQLSALSEEILETVENLKGKEIITAWNLGNGLMEQLQNFYFKPNLLYQQKALLSWMKGLVQQIKAIDPDRPLTMDVMVSPRLTQNVQLLHTELPEIDAFGMMVFEDEGLEQVDSLQVPYFFSYISVNQYRQLQEKKVGTFIADWQDTRTKTAVNFDGLVDHWGRYKPSYHALAELWNNKANQPDLPAINILRPAKATLPGEKLKYHALININDQWTLADSLSHLLQLEWYLVKNDAQGNGIFMTELGHGPHIVFEIPEEPFTYTLYLIGSKGNDIITHQSVLHTPLYVSNQ